jgi:hypothetical protein
LAEGDNDQRLKTVNSVESVRAKINAKVKALPVRQAKRKKGKHDKKEQPPKKTSKIRHL